MSASFRRFEYEVFRWFKIMAFKLNIETKNIFESKSYASCLQAYKAYKVKCAQKTEKWTLKSLIVKISLLYP